MNSGTASKGKDWALVETRCATTESGIPSRPITSIDAPETATAQCPEGRQAQITAHAGDRLVQIRGKLEAHEAWVAKKAGAEVEKLGLPRERLVVTVDHHANTSAASIPLALADALDEGRIKNPVAELMEVRS